MSHSVSVIDNKPSGKIFVFEGDFSIQNIETTKDEINSKIDVNQSVVVDINGVTNIDVSFLQLIYSLILYFEKNKISVQIASSGLSEDCKLIIKRAGFDNIIRK